MSTDHALDSQNKPRATETSLLLATALTCASWTSQFLVSWRDTFGLVSLSKFHLAFGHPQALFELMAEAAGASLVFPLLHIGVASISKHKRNSSTRRRIFIGWSIVILILGTISLTNGSRG